MQRDKSGHRKFILILLLALAIRLMGIASRPIWYDEAFSLLISEQGPGAILSGTLSTDADSSAAEEHPPAYYFMLWAWLQAFGSSVTAARILSMLASLGIVAMAYGISKFLFDEDSASVAGLLMAILPFQVHYGQEIRMYVFLALWLTLATVALIKKKWILFTAAAALAQYTHNLAAFYLLLLALLPLLQRDWKTLRAVAFAGLAAVVLYFPWLLQLPAQFGKLQNNFWIEPPGVERLFTLLLLFLPHLPLPGIWLMAGLGTAMLVIALAAYQTALAFKRRLSGYQAGLWFAYLSFAPPLLLWLISQWVPVYVERALLPAHVMFCIWLAWALTRTQLPRAVQLSVYTLIFASAAFGVYQHATYAGFPYGQFAQINQALEERLEKGGVIVHSSKLSYLPAFYFDRNLPQSFLTDPVGGSTDTLSPVTAQMLGLHATTNLETASEGASHVWFILYRQSIEEFTQRGQQTHPHLKYLGENFRFVLREEWGDLQIYLFTRSIP